MVIGYENLIRVPQCTKQEYIFIVFSSYMVVVQKENETFHYSMFFELSNVLLYFKGFINTNGCTIICNTFKLNPI